LLTLDSLKKELHRPDLTQLDKLLIILDSFDQECGVKDIKERARKSGLKITNSWNPSSSLSRSNGLAINTGTGWELTEAGQERIKKLGVKRINVSVAQVRDDLRAELPKMKNEATRSFVEEAIKCFEHNLHRSAVVMSWLAAMDVLYRHVHTHYLKEFNAEAVRIDQKWKAAKSTDDLGRMKESDFLDRISSLSIIGKNVRAELVNCLNLRNGCGHPNSLKLGANTVAHHIEILLMNVFMQF
jgi:hypothetical protein